MNDDFFRPIHDTVSRLHMFGKSIRRQSLSPSPMHLEISSLEYHAPVWYDVAAISRILVQSVISYDLGQPFIPAL